ncbi:MAG: DUF4250 domain-containing protein [Ruminococcus sp.]|nr:DUF4250 domain-containing protein [Ruminococcus sp.]MBP1566035.1 DUF4250 domain-containing protein [Oscillospiraceae bacterium]MBR6599447.1 DUF4250 domain-containing protein [Oscillospiraceae bacterium]
MLPNDPMMLLSVVNMKLRDFYKSLGELCDDMDVSESEIVDKLSKIGYEYNASLNRFQ